MPVKAPLRLGQPISALMMGTPQNVAIGASSAQSAAFAATTEVIRVVATAACWIEIAADPTATTDKTYLPAGVVEYFHAQGGWKIAVLQASAAGTLNITEIL